MILYDYPLSSASYRVRMALALKGIGHDRAEINLRDGAQRGADYLRRNPAGLVPALELDDGTLITQSFAILRYLDHLVEQPRLFPADPLAEAQVCALALDIGCDIHPLNNLRVLNYLRDAMGQDEAARNAWYAHWIAQGFAGIEARVAAHGQPYCAGEAISAADLFLVPQMFNARRFKVDLAPYPGLVAIDARITAMPAIAAVAPAMPG